METSDPTFLGAHSSLSRSYTDTNKRLVLHVGAAKCASTSIQASLQQLAHDCPGTFSYHMLNPELIWTARMAEPRQREAANYLDNLLKSNDSDVIILSHEYLSRVIPTLPTLRHLAQASLNTLGFSDVTIVCYTRSQSSYAASAYYQWHFRCRSCLASDIRYLESLGLNPRLFTPYERFLLSVTIKDSSPNWLIKLRRLRDDILPEDSRLHISSNHIPTKDKAYGLLNDFMARARLDEILGPKQLAKSERRANERFHTNVVHPVASLLSDQQDHCPSFYPSEHKANDFYHALSQHANKDGIAGVLTMPYGIEFSELLLRAIDASRRADNLQYCSEFGVDLDWFSASEQGRLNHSAQDALSQEAILELARNESLKRSSSVMDSHTRDLVQVLNQAMAELILEKWP